MYFLIVTAFVVLFVIGRELFVVIIPDAFTEFKRVSGITYETLGRFLLCIAIIFFVAVSIYFMWIYANGTIDLALLKGEDDLVKHLPDLC